LNSVFVDEIEWSCADSYLITSLTDDSIKVWNSESGLLLKHFENNHNNKIACLDCHPIEDHIFISGGHDGRIFVYDILNGNIIFRVIDFILYFQLI
jgi:bromodomain and WD repeat domain-containing protein 1/3